MSTSDATTDQVTALDAPESPDGADVAPNRRSRRPFVIAAIAVVIALAGGVAAAAWWSAATHEAAVAAAVAATAEFEQAENTNSGTTSGLERNISVAVDQSLAIGALLEAASFFLAVDLMAVETAQSSLSDELDQLVKTDADGTLVPVVHHLPEPTIPRAIDSTASTSELQEIAAELGKLTATTANDTAEKTATLDRVEAATAEVDAALLQLAEGVPEPAAGVLAASPSADQTTKDAFAAAVAELASAVAQDKPLTSPLARYVEAGEALQASHVAAEAKKVADAQAGGVGYTAPDGTYYPPTGGGGGSTPDTNRYIVPAGNYVPYSSCPGGGFVIGGHDPGPGGTSTPSFSFPWSYTGGGSSGFTFYDCS